MRPRGILAQAPYWDHVTRDVVLGRLSPPGTIPFFSPEEAAVAGGLVDRLLGIDESSPVPALYLVADRLEKGVTDGYRFDDMPPDAEAWRRSIAGLDKDAYGIHGRSFAHVEPAAQDAIIEYVRKAESWHEMPGARVFSLWMRYATGAYYSHPHSWDEIGFGGPAYPRGYKNLGLDRRETWERPKRTSPP
jgi:hypothetical protein